MNIMRLIGWLLLLFGAGLFSGEIFMMMPFIIGWVLIYVYPANSRREVKTRFEDR